MAPANAIRAPHADPCGGELKGECRIFHAQQAADAVGSQRCPAERRRRPTRRFRAVRRSRCELGSAQRLENADLAGALEHGRIHGLEDDEEADDDGDR